VPYRNPVIRGFHPDPSVCRVGDDYYLVTSSFEYFPGLPVFHSTDLVSWTNIGHCLTRPEQVDLSGVPTSGGIWAPTLRHHDGVFYVITTVMHEASFANELDEDGWFSGDHLAGRHLVLTATDPAGPWSDPVWVSGGGLDPSLLFDDGEVLMTHAEAGTILQSTVDLKTGERTSPTRVLWTGTKEITSEGPHLYRVGGTYYLLVAEGGTSYGHSIAVARSSSPWGPWESHPANPVLSHRTRDGHPVQATGHGDLVQDGEGRWWMVFLGIRARGYPAFHTLGRETFLAPVRWEDGWPWVDGPVELQVEDGPESQERGPLQWRDDFSSDVLPGRWNTVRGPDPGVLATDGRLVLRPTAAGASRGRRAFVGTRQTEPRCRAEVELVLHPAADGDVAGLAVRMDDRHTYDVAVESAGAGLAVRLRRRVGSLSCVGPAVGVPAGPVRLRVVAEPFLYRFYLVQPGADAVLLGSGEALYLSSEVAGGFTGVYLGVFAEGEGEAEVAEFEMAEAPAD